MFVGKAPGKLIISGEHAVVYGNPALAVAIDRYVETQISPNQTNEININNKRLALHNRLPIAELPAFKARIDQRYQQFLAGQQPINTVLEHANDLTLYCLAAILDYAGEQLTSGISLTTEASLPIGCGLGSSAALILSTLYACEKWLNCQINRNELTAFATQIENLQHGHSSSLDLQVSQQGGGILRQKTYAEPRHFNELALYVVNTGEPSSTTGECVFAAKKYLLNNKPLLKQFQDATLAIDKALLQNDENLLAQGIEQNQKLLAQIGIVPHSTLALIAEMASLGLSAKICGAGSIRGNAAGYVLVQGVNITNKNQLKTICEQHNLQLETLNVVSQHQLTAAA